MNENGKQDYQEFLKQKQLVFKSTGKEISRDDIHPMLFEFQRDLVVWSARKGRAAIFADTGLGKTFMSLEWGRLMGGRGLILAPLSVARQTVREGKKINVDVHYTRSGDDLVDGINITNYEMIDHFDASDFEWVVLDESSILKAFNGKTRRMLTEKFKDTKYKLCCSATPAPNDIIEIGRHSEFLGILTNGSMLSSFFVHEKSPEFHGSNYRLKGHAEKAFWKWMASWSMSIRLPSDLGYSDEGYNLPPLTITPHYIKVDYVPEGQLFFTHLDGIKGRSEVRKSTFKERCGKAATMVNASDEQWLVWCGLNDESTLLAKLITGAVEVKGSHSPEEKAERLEAFQDGATRVLVTKPKIAAFGMNFQNCANMAFVGIDDSYEKYYQAIRRCYRFGHHL
jgi:SNF2 family DNA or RNA helicase